MKNPGSNFVTATGLLLLSVLLLVFAYLRFAELEAVVAALLFLCLADFGWTHFSLRKLRADAASTTTCAFPGETFEIEITLKNEKFLPLMWLDLELIPEGKACIAPNSVSGGEESIIGARFAWIMPYQSINWTQKILAVGRGVCSVESAALKSGDGFGLTQRTRELRFSQLLRFVVYPEIIPVDPGPILRNMSELEKAENGFYEDKTLLRSTRAYREGDSFRNINWRVLARTDELEVNVYESLSMHRVCFAPDLMSYTYSRQIMENGEKKTVTGVCSAELEKTLSVIASLILRLTELKIDCTLVLPSWGSEDARIVLPEGLSSQPAELLTALAEISYSGEKTAFPVEEMVFQRHLLGQLYVFSMENGNEGEKGATFPEELGAISVIGNIGEDAALRQRTLSEKDFTLA